MKLHELSMEYRESGEMIKGRLGELETLLQGEPLTRTEELQLRRRINMLTSMARDAIMTSRLLLHYYDGD